tara:strand:+ start:361 stop:534 length:174 start_codon:yes stop_codon:yes gene_type:complete
MILLAAESAEVRGKRKNGKTGKISFEMTQVNPELILPLTHVYSSVFSSALSASSAAN